MNMLRYESGVNKQIITELNAAVDELENLEKEEEIKHNKKIAELHAELERIKSESMKKQKKAEEEIKFQQERAVYFNQQIKDIDEGREPIYDERFETKK